MKILIATDGSEFSSGAVEKICQLVKNDENTFIKIVSAYEPPVMAAVAPYAMPIQIDAKLEESLREQAAQAAAQAEGQIRALLPDLKVQLAIQILRGAPEQSIIEEAEKWGADLIVTGSHGYGFWERMFLGSVSSAIVHHAPCSVMVVRTQESQNGKH